MENKENSANIQTIYLAAGCFWGVEHKLMQSPGVISTTVGYMNGHTDNPTYKDVCSDETGHAEAVKVDFDANQISLEDLLERFWQLHDPTTLNRQGPDQGSQYRSGIFYTTKAQKKMATDSLKKHQAVLSRPIVTLIEPAGPFFPAEEYHQKYFEKNGGHCGI